MGNSSTKESRSSSQAGSRPSSLSQQVSSAAQSVSRPPTSSHSGDGIPIIYHPRMSRGGRSDVAAFLGISANSDQITSTEIRKETKQEREARRMEKERVARLKERERSLREEGVDGGYLVTLGTYTGPEDFNKAGVRQLMIERRVAPFWRGLNDFSDSWTEHQLVAAARGLEIPAADEIPVEEPSQPSSYTHLSPYGSAQHSGSAAVPIAPPSPSSQLDVPSASSLPQYSPPQASSSVPTNSQFSSSPLFRGRAKTLASVIIPSKNNPQGDMTPPEIQLPKDPHVNGQPIEAYLYKDASECPICFLYYPPYLNKTRCCDQPICSECFVQIKRPDPHPPEHTDPANPNSPAPSVGSDSRSPEVEQQLVSEPAACPFCVEREFGVTYDPPPFRRGLAYATHGHLSPLAKAASAMSSSSSLASSNTSANGPGRRRATSISANAPTVITTDKVRPDWAKKLSDARAHAARRSAAATALHTAAYMMGGSSNQADTWLGRRRRAMLNAESSSHASQRPGEALPFGGMGALLAALEGHGPPRPGSANNDLFPGRRSSRRNRVDDLEDIMMMEAIRQSLAAEDERKKKEEKEAAKQSKKEEKKTAKEQKKAEKAARKNSVNPSESNDSSSMFGSSAGPASIDERQADEGKGKAKAFTQNDPTISASYIGFNPLSEPTSTLNTKMPAADDESQPIREQTITYLQPADAQAHPFGTSPSQRSHLRQMSNASSLDSLLLESGSGTPTSEAFTAAGPAASCGNSNDLYFGSLAAIIDRGDANENTGAAEHVDSLSEHSAEPPNSDSCIDEANDSTMLKAPHPSTQGHEDDDKKYYESMSGKASRPENKAAK